MVGPAVVVGATVVVGAAVVAGATVVVSAAVVVDSAKVEVGAAVSELPPHPETTNRNVSATAYFFTASVCHPAPGGGGATSEPPGVDTRRRFSLWAEVPSDWPARHCLAA